MHKLAGIRVDPSVGNIHGRHGATSPRLVTVEGGAETALPLPKDLEVLSVSWTADGTHFALTVREADHLGLIFMAMAGYDPRAAPVFWERMAAAGGAKPPEFMSTHPSDNTRIRTRAGGDGSRSKLDTIAGAAHGRASHDPEQGY